MTARPRGPRPPPPESPGLQADACRLVLPGRRGLTRSSGLSGRFGKRARGRERERRSGRLETGVFLQQRDCFPATERESERERGLVKLRPQIHKRPSGQQVVEKNEFNYMEIPGRDEDGRNRID